MTGNDKSASGSPVQAVLREVRRTLGDLFGGKLDAKQEVLVQSLFALLGGMARADGVVSTEEANYTNALMDELKLSTRARQLATTAFAAGCRRDFDLEAQMLHLVQSYPRGSSEIDRVYESLLRLAAADALVRPGERRFLERVTLGLGFEPGELDRRLAKILH